MLGSEVDPTQHLDAEDLQLSLPVLHLYQHVMKCKQLGLSLDASHFSIEDIDLVYTLYSKIDEIQTKRSQKNGK